MGEVILFLLSFTPDFLPFLILFMFSYCPTERVYRDVRINMNSLQPRFLNQGVETLVLCVSSASSKKAWIFFKFIQHSHVLF
jgi:hypothetical protein